MSNSIVKSGTENAAGLTSIFGEVVDLSLRPDFIPKGAATGTEGITAKDIKLPRLAIAQSTSHEIQPQDPLYIPGLTPGVLFNDFTKQSYGSGPIFFIPVRRDVKAIEFIPLKEGGGVKDMNVPLDDPRLEWTTGPTGPNGQIGRVPPAATKFTEFPCLILLDGGRTEPAVFSMKETNKHNKKAITTMNGNIKFYGEQGDASVPIYGVIYAVKVASIPAKQGGVYGVPVVDAVGYVPKTDLGNSFYKQAEDYLASLEGKTIVVDRQPGDEDFVDLDAREEKR